MRLVVLEVREERISARKAMGPVWPSGLPRTFRGASAELPRTFRAGIKFSGDIQYFVSIPLQLQRSIHSINKMEPERGRVGPIFRKSEYIGVTKATIASVSKSLR